MTWLSIILVVNYGHTGRLHWAEYENILEVVALILINALALLGLQRGNMKWQPAFYLLGIVDFVLDFQCIFELPY